MVNVGFQAGIEELVHDVMKVPRVVRVLLRHQVISRFLRATPSALDFIALFLTKRFVDATDRSDQPEHDIVVMDMPAFGHAKQMLGVGRNVRDLLRVGPLATRGEAIDELVHDPARTAVVVVTLPEEMPVTETIEGYRTLDRVLHVPLGPVLINCTQPSYLDADQVARVEQMAAEAASGDAASAQTLHQAAERAHWTAERRARVEGLREELSEATLVEVPLFAGAVAGTTLTENVVQTFEATAPEADVESP